MLQHSITPSLHHSLACSNGHILRVLQVTGPTQMFRIYHEREEALEDFAEAA